ncbi:MAG: amidohydrolase family protein [Peptococcaceae bacterium]|nr:amidohydrolase family protein [Peptococcaceae bacterium]
MKYAFLHANILTGSLNADGTMPLIKNATMLVENDIITAIYEDALPSDRRILDDYTLIDLEGRTVIPGLINAHAHFVPAMPVKKSKPSKNSKPSTEAKAVDMKALKEKISGSPFAGLLIYLIQRRVARDTVASGVTTIRTVGGLNDVDARYRNRVEVGKAIGPRMLVANTAVSVPGGHMAGVLATEATCPEDAIRDIHNIAQTKPDLIKLMVTGGVLDASESGEPGVLKMDPTIVKAACDTAHALGYPVAAHTESPEGVKAALAGGVDTIEHGAHPDTEMIALFKQHGAANICTLSPALPYVYMDPAETGLGEIGRKNGTIVFDGIVDCAKACLKEGIPVGLGTDTGCPFITPYDMWREVYYFAKFLNVSPAFALHTATKVNADILGIGTFTGTLESGKHADFVVCDTNPLYDLTVLRTPYMVCANGRLITEPKVHHIKSIDRALDKLMPQL